MNFRMVALVAVALIVAVLLFLGLHTSSDSVEDDGPGDTTIEQTTTTTIQ
jgi:hypothetical protein